MKRQKVQQKSRLKTQQAKAEKSKELEEQENGSAKILQSAALLLVSCSLLVVACIALNTMGVFHMISGWMIPRGSVRVGVIDEEGEITSIPEGEIRYRVNKEIVFDNSYCRGSIMLENPKASEFMLQFSFYLQKDSENAVYVSPRLAPGECLLSDKLTEHVPKGYYACTCVVSAYDMSGNYKGQNTVAVNINIKEN